jgi:hypothetical protein
LPQAEPSPITLAKPAGAFTFCRLPASPGRCVAISKTFANPVATMRWPFDRNAPETSTNMRFRVHSHLLRVE